MDRLKLILKQDRSLVRLLLIILGVMFVSYHAEAQINIPAKTRMPSDIAQVFRIEME